MNLLQSLAKELTATFDYAGDKTYDGNANVINDDYAFNLAGIVTIGCIGRCLPTGNKRYVC